MRFDKLTTKFQQALQDAQSVALGNDQQFIEALHLLQALLEQDVAQAAFSRSGWHSTFPYRIAAVSVRA